MVRINNENTPRNEAFYFRTKIYFFIYGTMYIQNILKRGASMIEDQNKEKSIEKSQRVICRVFPTASCDLFENLLDGYNIK